MSVWIVYTQQESVGSPVGDRVTATFSLLPCCHVVLCYCSSCDCLHVPRLCVDSLIQFVCAVCDSYRTGLWDYIVDAMASGGSQPGADRSGIDFWVHVHTPWNAPESVVTLDSPGVVALDTSHVSDVLELRTRNADAEPARVAGKGPGFCLAFNTGCQRGG